MSQISRPFQIALAAMAVLGVLWFAALRPHSSTGSSSAPPAPAPAAHPATPSSGSSGRLLPGVKGLVNAVHAARGVVSQSQAAARAIDGTPAPAASASTAAAAATLAKSKLASAPRPAVAPAVAPAPASPYADALQVASELHHGKAVVLLFWNDRATDDRNVYGQLSHLDLRHGRVVVHTAAATQVAAYGSVTRNVPVNQTPTILVIAPDGNVTEIAGLQDAHTLQQAITDALSGGAARVKAPHLTVWLPTASRAAYIVRANALCDGVLRRDPAGYQAAVQAQLQADDASFYERHFMALSGVATPAGDRVYLQARLHDISTSITMLHQEQAASAAASADAAAGRMAAATREAQSADYLRLASQSAYDGAALGLARYGLTSCFRPEAP